MKRKSRIFVVLLALVFVCQLVPIGYGTDAPEAMWKKTFGGADWDDGYSVQLTSDGGYIITGTTKSFGVLDSDVYLVKINSSGSLMWEKTFGSWGREYGRSVQETTDGGYIITGRTSSYGLGNVYLIKTDSNGTWMWEKNFGGVGGDMGSSVLVASDGGYIIAGATSSFGAGGTDVWLIKTDSGGNLEWNKTLGGTGYESGESLQVTEDGGYIITGSTYSGFDAPDVYLVKTDSSGDLVWNNTFGGTGTENGNSVQVTADGGYIITGTIEAYAAIDSDVYLVKTDSEGNLVWEKTFGGTGDEYGNFIQVTADGGYIIAGKKYSVEAGTEVYLVKTDSDGTLEWSTSFGGTFYEAGYSVQVTADGGYIITGDTRSPETGMADVLLIRTNPQGEVVSQEETYSAWIVDVVAPSEVYVGEEFTVDVTVSYDFSVATEIRPGVFEYWVHETLVGTGTKTYSFVLDAPEEAGVWSLSADVLYTVEGELMHDDVDWVESFDVQVIALPGEGTYSAGIVDFVAPSEASAGEAVTVELTVAYEFTEPTEINPKIIDTVTGALMAEESEVLVGEGSKTYSFELTAPEAGSWALEASVWYRSEGEMVHDEVEGSESIELQVTAPPEETYSAWIVDVVAPSEVSASESFTVEITVSYDFSVATEIRPGVFEYWTHETLVGAGSKTYSFELTAPEAGSWALEASVEYISEGELVHNEAGWSESFDVQITAVQEETYTASILDFVAPSEVSAGKPVTVELTVSYDFTKPTEINPKIIDTVTGALMAEESEVLVGEGSKTYSFELTAPEAGSWALEASVEYLSEGELVHNEADWVESFDVQVTPLVSDDIEDDVKWEVSGETEDDDTEDDSTVGGIPGFPIEAIVVGLFIVFYLVSRNNFYFPSAPR